MSKQIFFVHFFKQPSASNSSSAILSDPDSDISENRPLRPPHENIKLTTIMLKYNESYVEYRLSFASS